MHIQPLATKPQALQANLLDDLLHPLRDPKPDPDTTAHDPGRPFTPPPPGPSPDEDDDGPSFPMDPVLA